MNFRDLIEQKNNKGKSRGGPVEPVKPVLEISEALKELSNTTLDAIQVQTAMKWGSRAVAAYTFALRSPNTKEMFQWISDGDEYRSEALEHAGVSSQSMQLIPMLTQQIDKVRQQALQLILA